MEEIIRFVTLAQTDRFTLTDLCEQFGISRKTGYKHLARYALGGWKSSQRRRVLTLDCSPTAQPLVQNRDRSAAAHHSRSPSAPCTVITGIARSVSLSA